MQETFFSLLAERVAMNNFSNERLCDAVNYILDNFQYKQLTISDIIRFDRRVKLYTYNEVVNMVTTYKASFNDFEVRIIDGRYFRVKKSDIK